MDSRGALIALLCLVPFQTGAPVSAPRCVQHVEAVKYPSLAVQARLVGEVRVRADIDSEGRVQSAATIRFGASDQPLLRNAAEENIRQWRFEPGVPEAIEVTYTFAVQDKPLEATQSGCAFDLPNRVTVVAQAFPVNPSLSSVGKGR